MNKAKASTYIGGVVGVALMLLCFQNCSPFSGGSQASSSSQSLQLQTCQIRLLAGSSGSTGYINGQGPVASFYNPSAVAVDVSNNIYVADTTNSIIRKITPTGSVTTYAGTPGATGSADGSALSAQFNMPNGIAVDAQGNVYVSDTGNNTIRKISTSGTVTTFAGSAGNPGSSDGQGAKASFSSPWGLTTDTSGNVYVVDSGNHTVRKITAGGLVSTLAGSAGKSGSKDGKGSAARFNYPSDIVIDASQNLYLTDTSNETIRKIDVSSNVTTLAGTAGQVGSADGQGSSARFSNPYGLGIDQNGVLYVGDTDNDTIRQISTSGFVSTWAGSVGNMGAQDGQGGSASFNQPLGLVVDSGNNVIVADSGNSTVRRISSSAVVTTLAGTAAISGSNDGQGASASFNSPQEIAVDSSGNIYVADSLNFTIRKITPTGDVMTLAGSALHSGNADGQGSAARFFEPKGIAVDSAQNVYVADTANQTIRKISSTGDVTTFAGTPSVSGSSDGQGSAASFYIPTALAVDSNGNIYVADTGNSIIRKISPAGNVTTLAGLAGSLGSSDGEGASASFHGPAGITVDSTGNVYVADSQNATIRKITSGGMVTTLAGLAGSLGSSDGPLQQARFKFPLGLNLDLSGNLWVADIGNSTLRQISMQGQVSTMLGSPGVNGTILGSCPSTIDSPTSVSSDSSGNLYLSSSNAILKVIDP